MEAGVGAWRTGRASLFEGQMQEQDRPESGARTVTVVSLGCPKNQVDAEVMLGQLATAGYRIADAPEQADLVVVNTCGFIREAKEESIRNILELAALKRTGRCKALVVSGCLSQRYRAELPGLLPEVDAFLGTQEFPRIVEVAEAALPSPGGRTTVAGPNGPVPRRRLTPRHLAYLKIAEGCDHACSFCAIPGIRGPLQSRPRAEIVAEAEGLAADGVRELAVVAQDTSGYGRDRRESEALVRLLEDLLAVPGLRRIRLHYLYPSRINRALIGLLAREPRLCRYVDMPLQHSDGALLRAMGRGGNPATLSRLVRALRAAVPGLVLRTTFITGFPGETREAFAGLCRFVEEMRFDRVGTFCYSDEEGTPAATLRPKVPRRVAEARRGRLMALQARIAEEQGRALLGTLQEVMVDGPAADFSDLQSGRLAGQAFEVDGQVYLPGPPLAPGTLVRARIREAFAHDLTGEVVAVLE